MTQPSPDMTERLERAVRADALAAAARIVAAMHPTPATALASAALTSTLADLFTEYVRTGAALPTKEDPQ